MSYYAVFRDITDDPCVIVGGGQVAARKARRLVAARAAVTVVSPFLVSELTALVDAGAVTLVKRRYEADDVVGADLVFAATNDPNVNRQVAADARRAGAWVNVADGSQPGDFIVPAVVRSGQLHVAISTSGTSPAFASSLRQALEQDLADGGGRFVMMIRSQVDQAE